MINNDLRVQILFPAGTRASHLLRLSLAQMPERADLPQRHPLARLPAGPLRRGGQGHHQERRAQRCQAGGLHAAGLQESGLHIRGGLRCRPIVERQQTLLGQSTRVSSCKLGR